MLSADILDFYIGAYATVSILPFRKKSDLNVNKVKCSQSNNHKDMNKQALLVSFLVSIDQVS